MLNRNDHLQIHENWVRFNALEQVLKFNKDKADKISTQELIDQSAQFANFVLQHQSAEIHPINNSNESEANND